MGPVYKLTYFDGKGRGEPVRFIFEYLKIPYEDVRISENSWGAVKAKTPWGALPVLEVDGQILAQSNAIVRYLGKLNGLAGDNDFESAKCDEMVEATYDFGQALWPWFMGSDEAQKKIMKEKLVGETVPKFFGKWNETVGANGGFLVGKKLSYADIVIACLLNFYSVALDGALDKYPALKTHHDMVHSTSGIKEWVAKRPVTPC